MKVMTCRELGGPCDQELSARTWEEMVKTMTKHAMEKHPDTARAMEKMHNEDPKKWGRETKPKWDANRKSSLDNRKPGRDPGDCHAARLQ